MQAPVSIHETYIDKDSGNKENMEPTIAERSKLTRRAATKMFISPTKPLRTPQIQSQKTSEEPAMSVSRREMPLKRKRQVNEDCALKCSRAQSGPMSLEHLITDFERIERPRALSTAETIQGAPSIELTLAREAHQLHAGPASTVASSSRLLAYPAVGFVDPVSPPSDSSAICSRRVSSYPGVGLFDPSSWSGTISQQHNELVRASEIPRAQSKSKSVMELQDLHELPVYFHNRPNGASLYPAMEFTHHDLDYLTDFMSNWQEKQGHMETAFTGFSQTEGSFQLTRDEREDRQLQPLHFREDKVSERLEPIRTSSSTMNDASMIQRAHLPKDVGVKCPSAAMNDTGVVFGPKQFLEGQSFPQRLSDLPQSLIRPAHEGEGEFVDAYCMRIQLKRPEAPNENSPFAIQSWDRREQGHREEHRHREHTPVNGYQDDSYTALQSTHRSYEHLQVATQQMMSNISEASEQNRLFQGDAMFYSARRDLAIQSMAETSDVMQTCEDTPVHEGADSCVQIHLSKTVSSSPSDSTDISVPELSEVAQRSEEEPGHASPEDQEFVEQVKAVLKLEADEEMTKVRHRQARRIGHLLDLAKPPGSSEALFVTADEAAKMLEPGVFFSGMIITENQQPLPLQTTRQFFSEYYDDRAKVHIQDPSAGFTIRDKPVRAVTIRQLQERFHRSSTKNRIPWNCLELATHVDDGLRPAFLNGEDCRLLTKLKLPSTKDSASRRSYERGWKEVEKWALLAQGGALTEPHQDSHGYSTYITINQGIVGFGWLSNPSPDERKAWRADPVTCTRGNWRYVVLRPGQTIFFPCGTVHFVFRLPTVGDTLAFGGHVLRCSQIVRWAETLLEEKTWRHITNEDLSVSAPAYLERVERFVQQALKTGEVGIWGGEAAIRNFLRLKMEFMK